MRRDSRNQIASDISLAPAARNASSTGASVDLANFNGASIVIIPGTITDGTHTPVIQESDDNSSWGNVAAAQLQSAPVALVASTVQRVGYLGAKRYIRCNVTVAGATTGGVYCALIIRANPAFLPVP